MWIEFQLCFVSDMRDVKIWRGEEENENPDFIFSKVYNMS